jgi:lysophospholipase L1-like esterase
MNKRFLLGFILPFTLLACSQEIAANQDEVQNPDEIQVEGKMTITASFEKWTGADDASKTYVVDGSQIHWAAGDADKVLYVFDSKGVKNVFSSAASEESATRAFTGDISEDSEIRYVLWSGKTQEDDHSELTEVSSTGGSVSVGSEPVGSGGTIEFTTKAEGGETRTVIGGSSLRVVNPQNISHSNSFAQEANIAVMKQGEQVLRNVFGYIRFTVPAGDDGHAAFKSVTFSADENLSGDIQIDYNGETPVAGIVANGSRSLTVNMQRQGDYYEPGTLYAVLPVGTYHNMEVIVTPVTGDAYTLSSKTDVIIRRGQFTDAGTLSSDVAHKPAIHLAGDSTCTQYGENSSPQNGWGQRLAAALDGDVQVYNRAVGGESTQSFIDSGKWTTLCSAIQSGDLVLIQFGHNDAYSSHEERRTDIPTYKANLVKMVNDARAKGGIPVLITSISTRTFSGGVAQRSIGEYPAAMRTVATDNNVPLIDANELTYQWLCELGPEGSIPFYLMDKRSPTGNDNTHLTRNGAEVIASMVAHGLKDLGLWKFGVSEEPLLTRVITVSSSLGYNIQKEGGSLTVNFSSTAPWKISNESGWIQVSPTSGDAGENLSLTITVAGNGLNDVRSAYVSIRNDGDGKHISIVQAAAEGSGTVWPNETDAYDYALGPGQSRKASYTGYADAGITTSAAMTEPVLLNDITYGAPGMTFYGNRMTTQKVNNEWSTEYPNVIPSSCYFSFNINKPGSVSFFQSLGSGIDRIPTYYLAIVVTRNGVSSAKIVDSVIPTDVTDTRPGSDASADPKYFVTLTVSKDDLEGMSCPATVYLYHRYTSGNTCAVHYYPLTWTSWDGSTTEPARTPKFLLAGDSTCTEYNASAAPQTGWGQCLSAALGGDPRVDNFAIGGESTKSFIDEGKWANLVADIVSGDIVIIQFGHNDEKDDEAHHTDPSTTYKENLTKFINETRAKGGIPVLATSICRRFFHSDGTPQRTHGDYPAAMREVATATGTSLIDTEELTFQWLKDLGVEGSKPYFVLDKRDPSANDNTHLTLEGAQAVAGMIAQGLKTLGLWE